jgi:hypothetical protein
MISRQNHFIMAAWRQTSDVTVPQPSNDEQRVKTTSCPILDATRAGSSDNSADALQGRFALVRRIISKNVGVFLGFVVIASSMALIGGSTSGASSTSQSSMRCGDDQLSVVWRGTTGGLAGTFGDLFWIRNEGTSPCVLSGFPSVAIYLKGKRQPIKTKDLEGHYGNDQMGVATGGRIPSIRLLREGVASFWVFGNDVASNCIKGDDMTITVKSLSGFASIPVPKGFQSWIYCGGGFEVNPMVPGVSGSDPPRPLSSEIMQ